MSTVKELIEYLEKYHKPEDTIAYTIWTVEDVLSLIKDDEEVTTGGRKITKEQAEEILKVTHHEQDANDGISWDVLRFQIEDYFSKGCA